MPNFSQLRPDMEWRKCASFDGYEVSEYGHLRRTFSLEWHSKRYPSGREYSFGLAGKGYPFYNIKVGPNRQNVYAHRLVAEAFIGSCPQKYQVAHGDGNKLNCHYSNLRYATAEQNNADKKLHGTHNAGDMNPAVKMTSDKAKVVLELRAAGLSQRQIGHQFGVAQRTVGRFLERLSA